MIWNLINTCFQISWIHEPARKANHGVWFTNCKSILLDRNHKQRKHKWDGPGSAKWMRIGWPGARYNSADKEKEYSMDSMPSNIYIISNTELPRKIPVNKIFFFIFLVKFFLSYSSHSLLFYISFRCTAQWLDNHALQSVPPNISRTHLTPYTVITISVTTFPLLYFMSQCLPIF